MFDARHELDFSAAQSRRAYLVEEGWAFTYKLLPNGGRQVIDIAVAGDILGMRGLLLRSCDYSGVLATPAVVHAVSAAALEQVFRAAPRIAAAVLWASSRDEALIVEHLVDLGRRSAAERVAHFMLELHQRLALVGLTHDGSFRCPLSQTVIADALGLTPIHLNRTIRQLREDALLTFRDGVVQIHDEDAVARLCGYDARYLDQTVA